MTKRRKEVIMSFGIANDGSLYDQKNEGDLVRCSECRFYRDIMYDGTPYEYGACELNPKPAMSPEFYCSFADRK